jgi:Radical SAM superfamily/4Fe-4S single cluster domain
MTADAAASERVHTEAIEVNAARHCNLACAACSHASGRADPWYADPTTVIQDLTLASRWFTASHVRVLGGEPLLHPQLLDLLEVIRRCGIAPLIRVITNGLTLHRVPEAFWELADEVHISIYPATRRQIQLCEDKIAVQARRSDTKVVVKYFDFFRCSSRALDQDDDLTARVYRTCQIGNRWRCLTLDSGRLYRCPQALFAPTPEWPAAAGLDYLDLAKVTSHGEVKAWLTGPTPLNACRGCAGSAGLLFPHHQLRPRGQEQDPIGVDLEMLNTLTADPGASTGCVGAESNLWTRP